MLLCVELNTKEVLMKHQIPQSPLAPVSRHELNTAIRLANSLLLEESMEPIPQKIAQLLLQINFFSVGQEIGVA